MTRRWRRGLAEISATRSDHAIGRLVRGDRPDWRPGTVGRRRTDLPAPCRELTDPSSPPDPRRARVASAVPLSTQRRHLGFSLLHHETLSAGFDRSVQRFPDEGTSKRVKVNKGIDFVSRLTSGSPADGSETFIVGSETTDDQIIQIGSPHKLRRHIADFTGLLIVCGQLQLAV